jgi:hypothetical protein
MAITAAYRARALDSYIGIQVAGSGSTTLDAETQANRAILCFQGALTGARVVRAPIEAEDHVTWTIKNETTGDFPLEFGVVGGNTYPVPRGDAIQVYANGTELSRIVGGTHEILVTLTAAQIKALHTTPITVVSAPGTGKMLEFLSAVMLFDYGGNNVFIVGAGNMTISWYNASFQAWPASEPVAAAGFIDRNIHGATVVRAAADFVLDQGDVENVPLIILQGTAITGNAANNNTMRVIVRYAVHETGW